MSGIGTGVGKSYATGYLAKYWRSQGINTITQKFIQTGNVNYSEDIELHRKIMEIEKTKEDLEFLTMPEIFSYPSSPLLASKIDGRKINLNKISLATELLIANYDRVLIEGAGGLMVPIFDNYLIINYISEKKYPLVFVTSGALGSINHTLLSLEAIKNHNIFLDTLIYNTYCNCISEEENIILKDTFEFIEKYLSKYFPTTKILLLPEIKL